MDKRTIKLLFVEDNKFDQRHFQNLVTRQKLRYNYTIAGSVSEATAILSHDQFDIIIVDYMLGDGTGFDIFNLAGDTPIIFVTGFGNEEVAAKALKHGAYDYVIKDHHANYLKLIPLTVSNAMKRKETEEALRLLRFNRSIAGIFRLDLKGQLLDCNNSFANIVGYATRKEALQKWIWPQHIDPFMLHDFTKKLIEDRFLFNFELQLRNTKGQTIYILTNAALIEDLNRKSQIIEGTLIDITKCKEAEEEIHDLKKKLLQAYDATLEGWSQALDLRDKETKGHSQRVTEMALRLARAMGLKEEELIHIRRGALLHDIGKLGIPDGILLKPGSLTKDEWSVMRQHPVYAYEWLTSIEYLQPALDIPYCHHERWDGTGYPRGLKGEEIPLSARIFAVVDIWDALLSDRPYRTKWSKKQVRDYIRSLAGSHLDPQVVKTFLQLTK